MIWYHAEGNPMIRRLPLLFTAMAVLLAACGCGGTDVAQKIETVDPARAADIVADAPEGLVILDVRTPAEFTESRLAGAIALGWLGVLLVAHPPALLPHLQGAAAEGLPALGVLIAVVGALISAVAYVLVRALARSEDPMVIVFYFPLMALPVSLPLTALDPVMPTAAELLWLAGVGLFTLLGQISLTRGLAGLPAARATASSPWEWAMRVKPVGAITRGRGSSRPSRVVRVSTSLTSRRIRGTH